MGKDQELPLSGYRVLDLTTTVYGPYTTQILGDFGADVVKIEAPEGDTLRGVGPARSEGMGAVFLGSNRNKRSLVLDLKREDHRRVLWRLVERADALVHNMRPQKMAKLGFDASHVLARNPRIVYAALLGYLEEGPYGGRPAYDDVVQGECGMAATFTARDGAPALVPSVLVDKTAALIAANGIFAALLQRERTGTGVTLQSAMFEGMVAYNLVEHQYGTVFSPPEDKSGYPRTLSRERRPFPTKDGHICMLAYTDRQWRNFWKLAGREELGDDPRFATISARTKNVDALYAQAAAILADKTSADWLEKLGEAEIPAGPVNDFDALRADPHLNAIGFYRAYEHPSEGALELPDTGYRIDGQKLPIRHHQPKLGEQSREVLQEAGYTLRQIKTLLEGSG